MLTTILKDVAPIITKVAPILANALGSPIAGFALSLLSSAFNTDPKDPKILVEKITDDTSKAVEILKQVEDQNGQSLKCALAWRMPSALEISIKVNWADETPQAS